MLTVLEKIAAFPLRKTALGVLIALAALTWLVWLFGADEVLHRIDYLIGFPVKGVTP